jgi:long-chain acyl-CoA synthetase
VTVSTITKTLVDVWEQAEQQQPSKTALIAGSQRLTYHEVGRRIRVLSAHLLALWHIQPGDVIALLAPNTPEFVITYFAVVRLGAIIQPIDERLTPAEISAILSDSQARALVVHHALWPRVEHMAHTYTPHLLTIGFQIPGAPTFEAWSHENTSWALDEPWVQPDAIAELMYTSGTTGEPKGVMRSHRNVCAASRNSILGFGYTANDVIAIVMPLSHSSALNSQMMPLLELGGALVLMERFDPAQLLALIRAEGVTCMRAVPTMIRMLLGLPDFCAAALPTLRLVVNSSAPIDSHTYTQVKHRFESIQVMNSYGLTEASTCTVLPDHLALAHPDSVGWPIEGVEMQVRDEAHHRVSTGDEGEICVRGKHVFVGYRGHPEKTQAVLIDGWLHTGDLAHCDENGLYYLHGRRDDVINCAGRKFAPVEVENFILQLAGIADVAVVGAPHPVLGHVGKAFVVLAPGASIDTRTIKRECARRLPGYKAPFFVEIVAALPRNSTGKVLRRKLAS